VAGVTKQTQRRWIDFAEIWVAIPIALTNCCANYSIISKVKMVYRTQLERAQARLERAVCGSAIVEIARGGNSL